MHPHLLRSSKFRMVKGSLMEVSPSIHIIPQRKVITRKSNFSKLETIIEEGPQGYEIIVPKRIFIVLPIFLSMIMFLFIYTQILN